MDSRYVTRDSFGGEGFGSCSEAMAGIWTGRPGKKRNGGLLSTPNRLHHFRTNPVSRVPSPSITATKRAKGRINPAFAIQYSVVFSSFAIQLYVAI